VDSLARFDERFPQLVQIVLRIVVFMVQTQDFLLVFHHHAVVLLKPFLYEPLIF
jgi:hypothetical protein